MLAKPNRRNPPKVLSALMMLTLPAFAQAPLIPREGTVTRILSGEEYLGTYSATVASARAAASISIPILRTDQVYVIVGQGMEYIITERARTAAHVIINGTTRYAISGDSFYFSDLEKNTHAGRIARQTLIDVTQAAKHEEPVFWKDVAKLSNYRVQHSKDTLYAEQVIMGKKEVPLRFEVSRSESKEWPYAGYMLWTNRKCNLSTAVKMRWAEDRIEGEFEYPDVLSKLNRKSCLYDHLSKYPLVWVPLNPSPVSPPPDHL